MENVTSTEMPMSSTSSFGTDQLRKLGDTVYTGVNDGLKYITTNKIIAAVLGMFLILYSAKAAPSLPNYLVKVLDHPVVKVLFMFLIAYIASKSAQVALITATVLFLTIQGLSYFESTLSMKASSTVFTSAPSQVSAPGQQQVSASAQVPEVQMTPEQVAVLNNLLTKIDANNQAAAKAEAFGNTDLAKNFRIEAFAAEMIVDAAVASAQHQMAAEEAKNNGDMTKADAHMQEAAKLGEKADLLLKAEQSKESAKEAEQNGNMDEAKSHLNNAYELLNKVQEVESKPSSAPAPQLPATVPSGHEAETTLAPINVTTLNVQSSCLPISSAPVPSKTEELNGYECNEYAAF